MEGVCVQLPVRVGRGERVRALEGERSGAGKEEGWLRVDTMAICVGGVGSMVRQSTSTAVCDGKRSAWELS